MAEMAKEWRITQTSQTTKRDGAFHLHLREGTTDVNDSWRITPPSAGGLGQTWLKGALSVTGHGRIEDLAPDGTGQATPALSVRGTLADALDYEVRVNRDDPKTVRGQFEGTDLRRDFRAGDAIALNGHIDLVERVEQDGEAAGKRLYLKDGVPPEKVPTASVKPQRDSALFVVQNGAGEVKLVVDKSGHVTATAFAGALAAQHLQGTLALERLPDLPASKVTEGELSVQRIPNLPASKITEGELSVQRIPNLDAAKITGGTLHADRIPDLLVAKITGLQVALDSKLNANGGTIAEALAFGTTRRQMINLYSRGFGIGIQDSTQYFRTDKNFAWYKGGGHTNDELQPGTNGTVQMVIKDGNVGIGTADPGPNKLKVQGNALIDGMLHVGPGSSTIAADRVNAVFATNNIDAGIAIAQNSGVNVLVQAAGAGGYIGTTSNHPLIFRTNNENRMSIDTNGNLRVSGTVYMANPLRHRMYPADPQVYQDIFTARDAGAISKLGNPAYDDTTYRTNLWDDGRHIIQYGGNNEQDGHGAKVVIPQRYDTVWVRVLGERWNVIHAYFLDGPAGQRELGLWTGGYRAANCYCPDGSLSDGYYNVTQWLPIPAGRAGELALISKQQTDKAFWLSGVAFSKNPWAHAAQSAIGYHWQVNGGDQVPWNTHNFNDDVLARISPKTNLCLKVPVVSNKRDKLLYLIEHNSNWNGCMHTAITVNNTPIERFLATYDNPFARHWNSKQYERYIAAMIPAALIPDGARYLDVRINTTTNGDGDKGYIYFREIGTHDLEIPEIS